MRSQLLVQGRPQSEVRKARRQGQFLDGESDHRAAARIRGLRDVCMKEAREVKGLKEIGIVYVHSQHYLN